MAKEHIVALVIRNVLDVPNILPLMALPAPTLQTATVCLHSRVISQLVKNAKGLTACGINNDSAGKDCKRVAFCNVCSESFICVL